MSINYCDTTSAKYACCECGKPESTRYGIFSNPENARCVCGRILKWRDLGSLRIKEAYTYGGCDYRYFLDEKSGDNK